MSTSRNAGNASRRPIVAFIVAALTLLATMGLTVAPASAAPQPKPTTTTAPPTTTAPATGGNGVANPKLIAVVSLSLHRALATYDRDLDAAALDPASYVIQSTQAVNLPVTAVSRATNNQAYLVTGPQEPVTYIVKKPKTSKQLTFQGATLSEPKVVSARPLSNKQIVVVFSERVGPSALNPANYQITVQGSTTTLAVTNVATYGTTGKEVLLTTAPQGPFRYILRIIDVIGDNGALIDPTGDTIDFPGSTIPAGPMLLTAASDGGNRVILTFDTRLDPASAIVAANYSVTPNLSVTGATLQADNKQVVLQTSQQYQLEYTIVANIKGEDLAPVNPSFNSAKFQGNGPVISNERPKVTSALSTGNTSVVVQFSKPMADNALNPSNYFIVQQNMNPEVAYVPITAAAFVDANRLSVRLSTRSQNETTYTVTATNVTDALGNPLADKLIVNGVLVADPTSFTFPGTAPTGAEIVNSDCLPGESGDSDPATYCDTLPDHQEYFGWVITVKLGTGQTASRQVTSNPDVDDSDGDGLYDDVEKSLNIDPRDPDTDDDGINDYTEFNEYFSDPANQDTDADGLYDGLETTFFFTSPIFADTDGDQLLDGYEINVNRNAKVADLPQPILTLGDMRLGLDVKFTESNGTSTRELESKTVEATLSQSQSQEYSRSESTTQEVTTSLAASQTYEAGWKGGLLGILTPAAEKTFTSETSQETSNTNSFTSKFTATSTTASEEAYSNSLNTQAEVSNDSNVTRDVYGARVQLGVTLEGRGNVAFTVKNLQVTALIQDPENPTRLTPITTLTPDAEPATGFNLGPLVPAKGPIVFTSTDVSPEFVEELMRNPRSVVFRFSNYDIVDEAGRNFAFTSQDINDRTARIAIDFGGFDANGDGRGDETEILRVATGVGGRYAVDTNGDGAIDSNDRKVIFDTSGKPVGLTMRDAMESAGLKWYDEDANPSSSLTRDLKQRSFSTKKMNSDEGEFEIIYRIRDREIKLDTPKEWLIITPLGIDPILKLDERILYPGSNVTLAFMADEDHDRLPALTEAMNGCIDDPQQVDGKYKYRDSDGDGLDDRFEVLVGWDVETPQSRTRVRSRCNTRDSDRDGLSDRDEAPASITYDASGLVVFDDKVSDIRNVSDLKANTGSPVVTSPSANFKTFDVGVTIKGLGIPDGATIVSVQSPTQATMSAAATATRGLAEISDLHENAPPTLVRTVFDLKTTGESPVVTSGSAEFTAADVGRAIAGLGIPDGAKIASVQSSSQATMDADATGSNFAAELGALYTAANDPRRDVVGYEPRSVTDLVTTLNSPTVTSASAAFTSQDIGRPISGAGIPVAASILSVESATKATMTANATATATGVAATIAGFAARPVSDLVTVGGSADVTSTSARFTARDEGVTIRGAGIPDGATILTVVSPTKATMTAAATASASGVAAAIGQSPVDRPIYDPVTDPMSPDTDGDGLTDRFELIKYKNALTKPERKTSPEHPDSDTDQLTDGVERRLGADPRFDDRAEFWDSDRDGLTDAQEVADDNFDFQINGSEIKAGAGWDVARTLMTPRWPTPGVSALASVCQNGTCPAQLVSAAQRVYSSKYDPDTDDDGLTDFEEYKLGTDPGCAAPASPDGALDCAPDDADKDSDGDGVRDGWDTDKDGLSDFQEVRGFKLADGTTVKTKATNVDTDNDKRSDGEEAGLPGGELIVRLPGGNVYVAASNPTRADSDFDLLVDGDEQTWSIDPTKPNTDGDNRTDYSEILAGRRPEVPDMLVKMEFVRLFVEKDAEKEGDAGDFKFRFDAVTPGSPSKLVVHSEAGTVGLVDPLPLNQLGLPWTKPNGTCPDNNNEDRCFVTLGARTVSDLKTTNGSAVVTSATANFTDDDVNKAISGTGIPAGTKIQSRQSATQVTMTANATATGTVPAQIAEGTSTNTIIRIIDGSSLPFGLNGQGRTVDVGSVSTIDAVPESFGVQGWLEERDNTDHTKVSCRVEIFPDVFGNFEDGPGLIRGSQLRPGQQSMSMTRSITNCQEEPDLKFTLVMTYTAQ